MAEVQGTAEQLKSEAGVGGAGGTGSGGKAPGGLRAKTASPLLQGLI